MVSTEFEKYDGDIPSEADLDQAYGSKYLAVTDVGDRKIRTSIVNVMKATLRSSDGTKQMKFALELHDIAKAMVLNKTKGRAGRQARPQPA
jgi:hypothetical protein